MRKFARIFTFVIHPATLTIPTVFLIMFHEVGKVSIAITWTLASMVFIAIIGMFILYGVKERFFSNVDISIRRQRVILYAFIISVVLLGVLLISLFRGPTILIYSGIFLVLSLIVFDIINVRIKASVHVASIATFSIILCGLYGGWAYLTLLFIPLIAWARIVQKRHTLEETIVGAISGSVLTILGLIVIQYLS